MVWRWKLHPFHIAHRRYPDLLVHRLIMNEDVSIDQLARKTLHCSERERLAEDCSRDALAWLKADFMARHLGERFAGVISGVMPFGVFVQITSLSIDGLLHVTQLPDGYYDYDETVRYFTVNQHNKSLKLVML